MKNLLLIILIALVPSIMFSQQQRLGFNPASINLSKNVPTGSLASYCADGGARSAPSSSPGRYKWFQNPGAIEVLVDGVRYAGGIEDLIQTGEIIIDTPKSDREILFRLNPESKITNIQINIKEPGIIADRPDDFLIEAEWLGHISKLKIMPEDIRTFEEAKPYIKTFQEAVKAKSTSGILDGETQGFLGNYARSVDDLISRGLLEKEFKSVDQVIKAFEESRLVNEWDRLKRNQNNIIISDFENENPGRGKYIISNQGSMELWETSVDALARTEKPIAKIALNERDIVMQEKKHIEKVQEYSALARKDNIFYCSVGSLDLEKKTVKIFFNDLEKEIPWAENPFEAVSDHVKSEIEKLPSNATVVFTRDELQLGAERFDKSDPDQLRGDPFHNLQYVNSRKWINNTELSSQVKNHAGERRIVISSIRNIARDVERLKSPAPLVKSAKDIMAFTAPESFGVKKDQVLAMRSKLTQAQISVVEIGENAAVPEQIIQSNLIILSGHKDTQMEGYLKTLADKGLLKDKIVIGFTCYENGTTSLNSYILTKGGAQKVLLFPTHIDVDAVKAVIYEIVDIVNHHLPQEGLHMEVLLHRAVDRAKEKYPDLVPGLELIRGHIQQIAMYSNQKTTKDG